jgi:hypothetical protein
VSKGSMSLTGSIVKILFVNQICGRSMDCPNFPGAMTTEVCQIDYD